MKLIQLAGLNVFFLSITLALAGGLSTPRKEDVPKYLKALQTSMTASERAKAAEMLGKRGSIAANDVDDAIEPLQKSLQKDVDASVRKAAAAALGLIRSEPAATVPLLIERLNKDNSMDVKLASVVALGQYGPDSKEAVPLIRELAKKFDAKKQKKETQMIQSALQSIGAAKKKKG